MSNSFLFEMEQFEERIAARPFIVESSKVFTSAEQELTTLNNPGVLSNIQHKNTPFY